MKSTYGPMNSSYVNTLMPESVVKLLDKLADDADSNRSEQIRNAIMVLTEVRMLHEGTQRMLGDELGAIHKRLVEELGAGRMLNKGPFNEAVFDDGAVGLALDGFVFYFDTTNPDRLLATRNINDDDAEYYVVDNGQLVLATGSPMGDPSMN